MKTESIDLDLSSYEKEVLINLITYAHERNITFNEAVVEIIKNFLDQNQYEKSMFENGKA
jgi:hypothetical protein